MRPNGYFVVVDARALELVLPLAAASLAHRRHEPNEVLVPLVVVAYLESMPSSRWYDKGLFPDIVARAALTAGPAAALLALQAWVLRSASVRLADWWGEERAGWHQPDESRRRGATREYALATQELFGCDVSLLDWGGAHEDWLAAWRTSGSRDPLTLERAGLHAAELELLALGDEEETDGSSR